MIQYMMSDNDETNRNNKTYNTKQVTQHYDTGITKYYQNTNIHVLAYISYSSLLNVCVCV